MRKIILTQEVILGIILLVQNMREWLSGGAPPCQGGGRGFDPRLALVKKGYPNGYPFFASKRRYRVYAEGAAKYEPARAP